MRAEISDVDRDAMHIMPLAMLPLQTPSLQRARMIKNARLNSVVELFTDSETGSGQIEVRDLPAEFNWPVDQDVEDFRICKAVATLPSYDVYSLRLSLRQIGIEVNDHDALRLSDAKNKELTKFMTGFTRPLIHEIYGKDGTSGIESFEDVIALFRSPDVKQAMERLKQMADKLDIRPDQVPAFLEDYADIFLSLGYFRQCLDSIEPIISEFLEALRELRESFQFREDRGVHETTELFEAIVLEAMAGVTGRFEAFDRASENLWTDISAERFRKVERLISSFHATNGGVLCSLTVKMTAWRNQFPNRNAGSPAKRVEFIQSELRQGLDKIRAIEKNAPKLSQLN